MLTTRLWIDGSSLAFIHGNKKNYRETIYNHIKTLTERFHTDDFNIILEDSKTNFRNKVSVSSVYKGQRRTKKKKKAIATYLPYLKNCFREIKNTYDPITYLNVENDDAIAILASRISNSVMIANDRDYLAVPGIYYNIKTNKTTVIQYPGKIELVKNKIHAIGYYQIYFQLLKGSPKENYKGVEGIGEKSAFNILLKCSTEQEMKQVCTQLFIDRYGLKEGIKKLEEGFRLSWIITHNESLVTPKPTKFSKIKI
tara:strand:- start:5011 stop:5775 length:765 start_codon:yes stop_codon:yes gene_type:complete